MPSKLIVIDLLLIESQVGCASPYTSIAGRALISLRYR